jgi:hypothetical protein
MKQIPFAGVTPKTMQPWGSMGATPGSINLTYIFSPPFILVQSWDVGEMHQVDTVHTHLDILLQVNHHLLNF